MFKTSLGKLAIGVVALSSAAVVHAEGGVVSMLKPYAVTVEGLPVATHANSWKTAEFFYSNQMNNFGVTFEGPTFANVGFCKFKFGPSLTWLSGKALHTGISQPVAKETADDAPISGAMQDAQKKPLAPNVSSGAFAQGVVTMCYDFTYRLQGLVKLGAGSVVPMNTWKSAYGAASGQLGMLYKLRPNLAVELGGKYIYTMDQAVKDISGLNLGLKYYI